MAPRTPHPAGRLLLALAAIASIAATAAAQSVTRGPYLQSGTETSVVVRWRTNSATNSRVRFGPQPGQLTSVVDEPTATTEHAVRLSGLTPSTKYHYAVGTTAGALAGDDANHFFVTSPPRGVAAPMRIWVLGDAGTGSSSQQAVRNAYYAFTGSIHTNLVLLLGDNAYSDGTDSDYQSNFFNVYPTMLRKSVVWSTLGNHDGHSASASSQSGPYFDIFTFPVNGEAGGVPSGTEAYYSFDCGNVHFVCLDSFDSDRSTGGAMLQWLTQDLAMNTNTWLVAFWHHPPYTKGSHDSDSESELIEMRQNALPILEAAGLDLVLCGHSHCYERSFLIDHHYGSSSTFSAGNVVDGGDGRIGGGGAYDKGAGAHEGAVYIVTGSAGQTSGGSLNHPAMFVSLNQLGSVVLDVNGSQLDVKFLDNNGAWQTRDYLTLTKNAGAPPESDFAGTPISGPAPLSVSFTDLSTNLPTGWAWNFGDGQSSTPRHPSHTYANAGSYSVTLTATNSLGSNQVVKTSYITVGAGGGGGGGGSSDRGGGAVDPMSVLLMLGAVALAAASRRRGSGFQVGTRAR